MISLEISREEGVMVMVFNAIFNNISAISWRSVLLVEVTGVPGENHKPAASHGHTLLQFNVNNVARVKISYKLMTSLNKFDSNI